MLRLSMPIVRPCAHLDCQTLTMGEFCIEHECDEGADVAQVLFRRAEQPRREPGKPWLDAAAQSD